VIVAGQQHVLPGTVVRASQVEVVARPPPDAGADGGEADGGGEEGNPEEGAGP
jgi:hypothetical protein